ncbi:MAG: peptidylprolyl isomerase, partial [Acidobacteriota bacterium]
SLIAARRELDERMASAFDDAEVESFHRDNAFSYTTPVELRVQMLVAPLGEVPERSLRRLEELASEIDAGTTDLQAVAREMNGRVESLGWLDAANLGDVPAKVRLYVQDLPRTGPTVPFRLGESLMLVEVLERREPRPLPFEEVEDQVRVDFIARHHQQLYEKVAEEVLSTAAFAFHPEVVTEHLRAGAPAEEPGGGADPEPQSGSTRGDDPEPAAV